MISSVPAASPAPLQPADRGGPPTQRSEQAVGQQAKLAVSEARSSGVELPKNAQGIAASAIARGIEPSSLFQALTAPPVNEAVPPEGRGVVGDDAVIASSGDGPDAPTTPATEQPPNSEPESLEATTANFQSQDEATARLTAALDALKDVATNTQEGLIDQVL